MALDLDTLPTIRAQVRDDIAGHLPGADASVPNSNMRVLAEANSGLADAAYRYIERLSDELLVDKAVYWLERHGKIWIGPKQAATFATGTVVVRGSTGIAIPALTEFLAGGMTIQTTEDAAASPGGTVIAARATVPGAAGNILAGATATFTAAIPGVEAAATIPADWTGGAETEDTESYRDRILQRIRKPPQGGAAHDYVAWAREVTGVTRAWASSEIVGAATVRFVMDDLRPNGIPTSDDCDLVAAHIDPLRPVTVKRLFVLAPTPKAVNLTIANLETDSPATRTAISASLVRMLRRKAEPGKTISRSWIAEAVSAAVGEASHDLTASNVTMTAGEIGVLGTVTYA